VKPARVLVGFFYISVSNDLSKWGGIARLEERFIKKYFLVKYKQGAFGLRVVSKKEVMNLDDC
jgi:hypothetical protein